MKHIITTFIVVLFSSLAYSQTAETGAYLYTTDKAVLYKAPQALVRPTKDNPRQLINLDTLSQKTLRKSQRLQILGITNSTANLHYDTYIVSFRDKVYYLPQQFVADNSYITQANNKLDTQYQQLQRQLDSTKSKYDALIQKSQQLCKQKIAYYSQQNERLRDIIDSIQQTAGLRYEAEQDSLFNCHYNNWYKSLPASTKKALKTIRITQAYLNSPNSAGGCDYILYYTNTSQKTIKYLIWEGHVYNAVNDRVSCEIRRTSYANGRDTGPVAPGQQGGGLWDCITYNFSARELKLSSITIQYMDNSTITISGNDIRRMASKPQKPYISRAAKDSVCNKAVKPYKQQLAQVQDSLQTWKNEQSYINNASNYQWPTTATYNSDLPIHLKKTHEELLHQLKQVRNAMHNLEDFKNQNFLTSTIRTSVQRNTSSTQRYTSSTHPSPSISMPQSTFFGIGIEGLLSTHFTGSTIPIEVLFGRTDQLLNFSIEGSYSYLKNDNITINQFNAVATVHLNLYKNTHASIPLSLGIGYNTNFGNKTYQITGTYFEPEYTHFSFPIYQKKNNISLSVGIGFRWRHNKLSIYGRFNLTPLFDTSHRITNIPEYELYYDDITLSSILEYSASLPLFGISWRYYF